MRNVTNPRVVSFEDALRNLASKLTGTPAADLPRTQEAVVQFMAENVPSVSEMAEAVIKEVIARLAELQPAADNTEEPAGGAESGADGTTGTAASVDTNNTKDGSEATEEPKSGKNSRNK